MKPYIGNTNRVYEILGGRRQLSLEMIRRLHSGLKIPAEVLIG
jgi:HTH-type transcriptional regulator/antitoxin HigA